LRSLEEWLAHQERVHPRSIDLGLGRLARVLERLRWVQPPIPVITVAGTNGKGSVAAYAHAILAAAGYRVGTFTSPHIRDYRERIRVHDAEVGSDALIAAFERIEAACRDGESGGDISLTFFEYNALAAFLVFEAAQLDAWVLEVGLGGRLDAVNVVDPSVAVVVSIGFDHQEYLGSTLEAIAREKAGIFRPATPAILGSYEMPPVLEECAQSTGAWLKRLGHEFDFARNADRWRYRGTRWDLPDLPQPGLLGDVQFSNAATAIAAVEELADRLDVSASAIAAGLASVRLTARFQVIEGAPAWILDVAHNPAAAGVLAQNLRRFARPGRTLAVCGILADKDAAGVAVQLADCIDEWWLAPTDGARGTSGAALAQRIAPHVAAPIHVAENVAAACAAASAAASASDRIVVFGSFHTVAPAMDWLEGQGILPPDFATILARRASDEYSQSNG
jgi:dihydrofolate synthase/folylpolyglutamate synthase